MNPPAGTTCKFVFSPRFTSLDGVYRVRAQTTFKDAVDSEVDFVANLYDPAGLSVTDFNADYADYLNDVVLILEAVEDAAVTLYAPESLFAQVPDPTIREYLPLVLAVDLGVQKNTQAVLPLIEQVGDLIKSILGTTNPARLISSRQNKLYLTDAEYAVVEAARADNIRQLTPLRVQLKTLQDQNTYLAAQLKAYEDLIIAAGLSQP